MDLLDRIFAQMVEYFQGDPRRIQHFVKVHAFARLIGHREGLDAAVSSGWRPLPMYMILELRLQRKNSGAAAESCRSRRGLQKRESCWRRPDWIRRTWSGSAIWWDITIRITISREWITRFSWRRIFW